jgi:predicted dehydrogenase
MDGVTMQTRVAIVGAGNIAGPYAKDFKNYPEIEFMGVADVDPARAEKFAAEHGTRAYGSFAELLADDQVELIVNLTSHFAHKEVTEACLNAGKHVYSEKPLALTYEEAQGLVDLAQSKRLRLGCSPFTLMGEAQQTAWKMIRDGKLGTVRIAYAEVNWGRIESWHPEPSSFYEVGPLFDVGVYPLTILTAMFGPAKSVLAYGKVVYKDRVTKRGVPFSINTPDFAVAVIELESGVVVRLTTDFYINNLTTQQTGIEFHGDLGSAQIVAWQDFDSPVLYADFGKKLEPVAPVKESGVRGTPWGRGVYEMVLAMQAGQRHRFTGEQAAHVVEILTAAARSMQEGRAVEITSTFTPPTPMEWAL